MGQSKDDKSPGFMDMLKNGIGHVFGVVSSSIPEKISQGAQMVMDRIDQRIMKIENRIMSKMYSFLLLGLGILFLVFALFFFIVESLGLHNSMAFLSLGAVLIIIGLLLKLMGSSR